MKINLGIKSESIKSNLIFWGIILIFLSEIITNFYVLHYGISFRLTGLLKLLFQGLLFIYVKWSKIPKSIYISFLLLIIIFTINQLIINDFIYKNLLPSFTKGSIYYLNRFLFIFLFIASTLSLKNKDYLINKISRIIDCILIINGILIITGFLFDIDLFKSYPNSSRFGYNGAFNKLSIYMWYIIFLSKLYYNIITEKRSYFLFFFILFASVLTGSKIILFFLLLLIAFHFFQIYRNNKKIIILIVIICSTIGLYSKRILSFYFNYFIFWKNMKDKYSIITMAFSTRDLAIVEKINYIKTHWSGLNYIFGGPFYNNHYKIVEMSFFDVFLFFGLMGTIIYINFLKKWFFGRNLSINILLGLIILCASLAGGLFFNVLSIMYLFVSFYLLNKKLVHAH